MKKQREYKVGYKKYVESFQAEKRENNIVNGVRQRSYKKYRERRNDGWTNKEILYGVKDSSGKRIKDTSQAILDPAQKKKTWKKYVDARRLEITCGEAPYLASRYDTVTGKIIPIDERVGLLDRKLRVVGENTESRQEWMTWARRAIESIYGYEFQGDNLLLARENIFYTYIEYYKDRFGEEPDTRDLHGIAHVISWNLWQMDGFNYAIPFCKVDWGPRQLSLFDYIDSDEYIDYSYLTDTKGQQLCKIRDWRSKETLLFKNVVEEVQR